jgi:HPt (histidine-containing phosphotransfer) domain-containing protein
MLTDLTYLKSMANDDVNFLKEMVDIFREQVGEYSTELPKLLANEDYDSLSKLAHKAKSSVAIMGMTSETNLLAQLEQNAKNRVDIDSYHKIINTFIENASLAIIELDNQLNNR